MVFASREVDGQWRSLRQPRSTSLDTDKLMKDKVQRPQLWDIYRHSFASKWNAIRVASTLTLSEVRKWEGILERQDIGDLDYIDVPRKVVN